MSHDLQCTFPCNFFYWVWAKRLPLSKSRVNIACPFNFKRLALKCTYTRSRDDHYTIHLLRMSIFPYVIRSIIHFFKLTCVAIIFYISVFSSKRGKAKCISEEESNWCCLLSKSVVQNYNVIEKYQKAPPGNEIIFSSITQHKHTNNNL